MKVNELAKISGISASKIRYYDRVGIISGKRNKENNYREYGVHDVLTIYDALMYRGFDMSMEELLHTNNSDIDSMNQWLDDKIDALESQIKWDTIRLNRFKEMKAYYGQIEVKSDNPLKSYLDGHYCIYNLGYAVDETIDTEFLADLVELLPFSYIGIKLDYRSLVNKEEIVKSSLGVGMLKRNVELLKIDANKFNHYVEEGVCLSNFIKVADPFSIKYSEVKPMIDWLDANGYGLNGDFYGRIYFVNQTKEDKYYVLALGCPIQNKINK